MITQKTILICLFLFFDAAGAQAGLYKWTDSAGRDNYVDDVTKVPPEYRKQAIDLDSSAPLFNVQSPSTSSTAAEGRGQAYPDNSGKGESWWRNEAEGLRTSIKRVEEGLDYFYGLQNDCTESQKNIISPRNRDCGNLWIENIRRVKIDLERLKKKLEVDLPEEARKAGVPPGWLRKSNDTSVQGQAGTGGKDETWWRNRAKDVRDQLSKEQGELDYYNAQERECEESQKYNTGCRKKNCKVIYESQKKYAEQKVKKLKQTLEVELPEEARRTGAYPGWLRE